MTVTAEQRRVLLSHPAGWIAIGFGSGLSLVAPGTFGSFVALLPWLLLRELPWPVYVLVVLVAFAIGVWACNWVVDKTRIDDPGFAVWDEFVGQWIALVPLVVLTRAWYWIFAGFILFRIFDIWKPWPVSWADRNVKAGIGVMLDDVIAGMYVALILSAALLMLR